MPSILAALRDIVPDHPLTFVEALDLAELQAERLLELTSSTTPPTAESVITDRPHIQVVRLFATLHSAASRWSRGRWLIILNASNSPGRQRFSLAHEFKHILDNPFEHHAVGALARDQVEQVCDYFAACLLMPRGWVMPAWAAGPKDLAAMAAAYLVSRQAMEIRLIQLGLTSASARHPQLGAPS